jgi:hypothetical protein
MSLLAGLLPNREQPAVGLTVVIGDELADDPVPVAVAGLTVVVDAYRIPRVEAPLVAQWVL